MSCNIKKNTNQLIETNNTNKKDVLQKKIKN